MDQNSTLSRIELGVSIRVQLGHIEEFGQQSNSQLNWDRTLRLNQTPSTHILSWSRRPNPGLAQPLPL
jgi:hypothetical protein